MTASRRCARTQSCPSHRPPSSGPRRSKERHIRSPVFSHCHVRLSRLQSQNPPMPHIPTIPFRFILVLVYAQGACPVQNPLENHEISADIPLVLEYNSKIHCLNIMSRTVRLFLILFAEVFYETNLLPFARPGVGRDRLLFADAAAVCGPVPLHGDAHPPSPLFLRPHRPDGHRHPAALLPELFRGQ